MNEEKIVINIPPVEKWTMKDLKYTCKHKKVKGYTKMSREELIENVKIILKHIPEKNKQETLF